MHEFSLADSLMTQIAQIAKQNKLNRIDSVSLETGALREVVPDIMRLAFEEMARGTIAQGATLLITEIEAIAQCNTCGQRFKPERDDFSCPQCEIADVRVIQGDDIILRSISSPDHSSRNSLHEN